MDEKATRQFAIEVTKSLISITKRLCYDRISTPFCAILEGILVSASKELPGRCLQELIEFLDQLEKLCQNPFSSSFETGQQDSAISLKQRFPTLTRLLDDSRPMLKVIRDAAKNLLFESQRQETLAHLDSLVSAISDGKMAYPSDQNLQTARNGPANYGRELALLYETIFTHCTCSNPERNVAATARLRLQNNAQDDEQVAFGVIFKEHPHHDGIGTSSQPWWQDTHISVQSSDNSHSSRGCEHQETQPDSDPSFCDRISRQLVDGYRVLHFSIIDQRFYYEKYQELKRVWELRPSISLRSLLREISFSPDQWTEKRKEVLSWLLAKAVWQYYSTPWMLESWTNESVHFLFEKRRTGYDQELTGIFVNEPFLLIPTTRHPCRVGQDLSFDNRTIHKFPKILALGVMLVEIQLGLPIQSLYAEDEWARYCPMERANPNSNFQICRDITSKPGFFEDISDPLEVLIKNCIWHDGKLRPPRIQREEDIPDELSKLVGDLDTYVSQRKPNNIKPLRFSEISIEKDQPDIGTLTKGKQPIVGTILPTRGPPQHALPQALRPGFSQSHYPTIERNPFMSARTTETPGYHDIRPSVKSSQQRGEA